MLTVVKNSLQSHYKQECFAMLPNLRRQSPWLNVRLATGHSLVPITQIKIPSVIKESEPVHSRNAPQAV
jgi:hypothetical protein